MKISKFDYIDINMVFTIEYLGLDMNEIQKCYQLVITLKRYMKELIYELINRLFFYTKHISTSSNCRNRNIGIGR